MFNWIYTVAYAAQCPAPSTSTDCGMTTSTLATNIGTVGTTLQDYFGVLITTYLPYLLGFIILVGVVVFGKRIIAHLFGK